MIEKLYRLIDDEKIKLIEDDLTSMNLKGLCIDNIIVMDKYIDTEAERRCVLAEEIGHYKTTSKVILDQSNIHNFKQEETARRWAVKHMIHPQDFIDAYKQGVNCRAELAEFLNVTEDFIEITINHFSKVHGECLAIDDYVIFFSPLWVYKKFE